ncbi:MAG TPA: hypothetical protein VG675_15890 [Bryobacteraceae bacterium]|nr:hypothetical protein [Bryobacteraceae bacterium]
MFWVALLLLASTAHAQPNLSEILSRVAEEAEVLWQKAPEAVSQETLVQRAWMPPSRFHPRVGKGALAVPQPRLQVREIVSEYSVGKLRDSQSGDLLEFRQVISVDGHPVQSQEEARHALSLGLQTPDDRVRKRMIEDFAHYGLVDVATDYGIILLAFTRRGQQQLKIEYAGEAAVGGEDALALSWQQLSNASGALEFNGRQVKRYALQGTLYVRKSDSLPLRVEAWTERRQSGHPIRDEAMVDYAMTPHGFVAPVSVLHRHLVDGKMLTENQYRYAPFRLFSSDAEIKFTATPDAPASKEPVAK